MSFFAGPVLGMLSDRFGRRPVLLVSLAGLGADFLFMAFAPSLMLVAGRADDQRGDVRRLLHRQRLCRRRGPPCRIARASSA